MKRILVSVLLGLFVAGSVLAQTAGTNTVERNGYYFNATTGDRVNADGSKYVVDQNAEYLMDFGVTNLLAAAATDTGVTTIRRSAAVDVRQYTAAKTNIIIHVQPAAADTLLASGYWYDLAVAVYPLTSTTLDLTTTDLITTGTTGVPYVPLKASLEMLQLTETDLLAASAADSVGSYGVILTPNAANLGPGERRIRFSATRPVGPHLNPGVFQTVMLPLSFFLGNVSPRYLCVQVRHIQKATGATGSPSIRVDMEGLR